MSCLVRMASFLQSMGISTEDVWTLFMTLGALMTAIAKQLAEACRTLGSGGLGDSMFLQMNLRYENLKRSRFTSNLLCSATSMALLAFKAGS